MDHPLPSPRRLVITWALLAGLTAVSLLAAGLDGNTHARILGFGEAAVVVGIAAFKAQRVLADYLNLRTATAAWRGLFTAFLVLIAAMVLGAQAAVLLGVGV